MRIYDSRLKKKVELEPLIEGKISMYVCGPTVYDLGHLGHGRSAVAFDVIRRYFEYKDWDVNFVSNYTDIDDKMIKRAAEEGITVPELADKIIPEYEADYGRLGIKPPTVQPCATDHIEEMVGLIGDLEKAGLTYVLDDGVYFDIEKHEGYGDLSGQRLEDLQPGSRVGINEQKRSPYDFVLWKLKKEGEPFWPSPWGDGRPGWHIECSAMSAKHLGKTFDIHGGGRDLIFPHHECEMAQSCGAYGKDTFAKYWIHNGFINIDNEKMSKSLDNFFTLRDIFVKYDPKVVRLMFMQTQYRNPINFSQVLLDQAASALERIHNFLRLLDHVSADGDMSENVANLVADAKDRFEKCMDDDFDTSGALGSVFELVKELNILMSEGELLFGDRGLVLDFLSQVDQVLGVILVEEKSGDMDDGVEALIKEREEARLNKDFATSDRIRDELKEKGIEIEDTPNGTTWKKV